MITLQQALEQESERNNVDEAVETDDPLVKAMSNLLLILLKRLHREEAGGGTPSSTDANIAVVPYPM